MTKVKCLNYYGNSIICRFTNLFFSLAPIKIIMLKLFLACLYIFGAIGEALLQGDLCGVEGSNFLNESFVGSIAVAGKGCASANNTNCLCAPDFDYPDSSSEFTFQCNGKVKFGPKNGKVCPTKVPVIRRVGVGSIDFSEALVGVTVPCDTSIHPTGRPGDENCGYSECESGGSFSAICGCVDLGNRDGNTTGGMQWVCLHSTCRCSLTDDKLACKPYDFACALFSFLRNLIKAISLELEEANPDGNK